MRSFAVCLDKCNWCHGAWHVQAQNKKKDAEKRNRKKKATKAAGARHTSSSSQEEFDGFGESTGGPDSGYKNQSVINAQLKALREMQKRKGTRM